MTPLPRWLPVYRPDEIPWDTTFREVLHELASSSNNEAFFSLEEQRRFSLLLASRGKRDWEASCREASDAKRLLAMQSSIAAALVMLWTTTEPNEIVLFEPLDELFSALCDLEAGVSPAFLKPRRQHPLATDRQREFKIRCVRAVLLLGRAKVSRAEARQAVKRRVVKEARVLGLTIGPSTLKNWQADYDKSDCPHSVFDRLQWDRLIEREILEARSVAGCADGAKTLNVDRKALLQLAELLMAGRATPAVGNERLAD